MCADCLVLPFGKSFDLRLQSSFQISIQSLTLLGLEIWLTATSSELQNNFLNYPDFASKVNLLVVLLMLVVGRLGALGPQEEQANQSADPHGE